MIFAWLKRYTPSGLYWRAALILLVPMVSLLAIVSVVFIQRHYQDVALQMTTSAALEFCLILSEIAGADTVEEAESRIVKFARPLGIDVQIPATAVGERDLRRWYDFSAPRVYETLRRRVRGVLSVDLHTNYRFAVFWVDTKFGPARISLRRDRLSASNPHQFLILMLFVAFFMSLIAFIFLRNQLRPIRRLAKAAEAFGRGRVVEYRPSGATEVRSAGDAFLDMRGRIERQIEQRTMMLSGVSHDLRTPLTRMKLALSMVDDRSEAQDLRRDVEDMERLLDEFLAFARGDVLDDPVALDAQQLLVETIERLPGGTNRIELACPPEPITVTLRPMAMRRAVTNLIENALRYGEHVRVGLVQTERSVKFVIEDDGPGIAPGDRDEALKAFVRLDAARNQDRGTGVGLGLSIAQDIARRHGGMLRLGQSEALGGLKVEIVLPK